MLVRHFIAGAAALCILVAATFNVTAAETPPRPGVRAALESLQVNGPVSHRIGSDSGLVTFLSAPPGKSLPVRGEGTAEERARSFILGNAALFGLRGPDELLTVRTTGVDRVGMEHVRFQQTYNGIPVTGGEMTVHLRSGGVASVHARTLDDFAFVDFTVDVQAPAALERAARALGRDADNTGVTFSEPRLELLNRAHLGGPEFPTRLAWFVEARAIDLREYIWIDARSGITLLQFSQLTDALSREIYDADDPTDGVYDDLPGALVREEGDPDLGAGDHAGDANAAYDYSGDTYDYFFAEHGRDSYDDAGAPLMSTVHFCPGSGSCPYSNAFWNGTQMVYGQGFPVADDVDAHELTHAVTEHTANLFYYMQPGALNESFSDIFGETVDLVNGGNDPADRWLMGEEIGEIRDMMTPTAKGDPGKVSDAQFVCTDGQQGGDAGGVHSNSGVPNHAYALMVDGGTFNSVTVNGIGLAKAGKIQYRVLSEYLVSSSNFVDGYDALLQACQDLVGVDGITVGDCAEVQNALDAVEMDQAPSCATPEPAAVCELEETPQDLFYDDFEELPGDGSMNAALLSNWEQNVIVMPTDLGGNAHFGNICCLGPFATSGTGNVFGYNTGTVGDAALEMSSDVTLPSNAFIHFRHSFGFENVGTDYYDGGVLEYSIDGGASWSDAGGLIDSGPGYVGTVESGFGNPLAGRSAFVGDSRGYSASRLELSGLGGSDLRFRFRIGTDNIATDYGWFIDDFRIYTCDPVCPALVNLANHVVTGVESETACSQLTVGNDGAGDYVVSATGSLTLTAPLVEMTGGFRVEVGGTLAVGPPVL